MGKIDRRFSKRAIEALLQINRRQAEIIARYKSEENDAITPAAARQQSCGAKSRPIIFASEMDYISRCILDYPDIETGGQLFGYWTEDGIPVVLYAIGPGRAANHQRTFFNQDVDYLLSVGNALRERFGLHHIGEWHSHHRLGLAHPSGHDATTMISTIREKGLGRFLLCIGNCDGRSSSLNPFMCDETACTATSWNVVFSESPLRRNVDGALSSMLEHPKTPRASHRDARFTPGTMRTPSYHSRYWMMEQGSGEILNGMLQFVQRCGSGRYSSGVKLDGNGLVHIVSTGYGYEQDILFPEGFPEAAPVCTVTECGRSCEVPAVWRRQGDLLLDFERYYRTINRK